MSKVAKFTVEWEPDTEYGGDAHFYERLLDENGKTIYRVNNLYDCPEDAIIVRDLVSAYEIIDFIKLGMKLADEGYTSVEVEDKKVDC